jgi:hypothetical protein
MLSRVGRWCIEDPYLLGFRRSNIHQLAILLFLERISSVMWLWTKVSSSQDIVYFRNLPFSLETHVLDNAEIYYPRYPILLENATGSLRWGLLAVRQRGFLISWILVLTSKMPNLNLNTIIVIIHWSMPTFVLQEPNST